MKHVTRWSLSAALLLWSGVSLAAEPFFQISLWGPDVQIIAADRSVRGIRLDLGYGRNTDVAGLDLGLGNHATGMSHGWQLGLVNVTEGDFKGLQWSFLGYSRTDGNLHGWQAGLASQTKGTGEGLQTGLIGITQDAFTGLQIGAGYAAAGGTFQGAQFGLVSMVSQYRGLQTEGSLHGLQVGFYSAVDVDLCGLQIGAGYSETRGYLQGVQLGVVNRAGRTQGLQLGLLNWAAQARGLQLGVINIAQEMNGLQIGLGNFIKSKEHFQGLPLVNWNH